MILFSILFSMLFLLEVVHRTTISRTFHKAGLNREAANHMKCYLEFPQRHVGDSSNMWKTVIWSDEIKPNIFCLGTKC